jgi:hypothetical protein
LHDLFDELGDGDLDGDWIPTEKLAETENEGKETVKSPKKRKQEKSRVPKPKKVKKPKKARFNDAFKSVQIADNGEAPPVFISELFVSICFAVSS